MSKTIEQALSEIADPEIRARALDNRRKANRRNFPDKDLGQNHKPLDYAFNWYDSPEKWYMWRDVREFDITTWQQACEKYPHLRELPLISEEKNNQPNLVLAVKEMRDVIGKYWDKEGVMEEHFGEENNHESAIKNAIKLLESNGYRVEKKIDDKIERAKDIIHEMYLLYHNHKDGHTSTGYGNWELNNATDAMYAYIKIIEESCSYCSKLPE